MMLVFAGFFVTSCSREDEDMPVPQANIQITMPIENTVVRFGETLNIKGTATSATELHGYEIAIRKAGGSVQYFQHYHGHGNTITIEESWKNTINETSDMDLEVSVILDHEQNKQTKTIRFKILN